MLINLQLPLAPSVNSYQPHANRGGRCIRYYSQAAERFKQDVRGMVLEAKANLKLTERLAVHIYIYPKDNRKQDIDNRIKPVLDALEYAEVYENDCQIDELVVKRMEKRSGGLMIVELYVLE